ncbi:hypothetical protein DH2020_028681 [Rehmannia glutinosa]|uniref:FBD domain-containing protein n=1 Tax=Rehmannia glutinosa TaxID=99300 RepID=A0ABR0VUE3_REHGL
MEKTEQSSRKRLKKVLDGNQIMPSSIDRLSGLPDAILIHILSFLPTKLSVATSILARRWRILWAHVPNLDFDSQTHSTDNMEISFGDIINRVIMLRKFPRCIFTCKTLVDLRLRGYLGYMNSGEIISLPNLKKLHLSLVLYGYCDQNLPHFLSGCPVLEELIIDGILDQHKNSYIISSPSIKRLMLNFLFNACDSHSQVVINAPSLRYFKLNDCFNKNILAHTRTLNSLIEADISLNNSKVVGEDYSYTLSFNFIAFGDQPSRSFDNLTKLELDADCLFLKKFLESAENLQVLILREVHVHLKHWMEPNQVPKCLLSHLTTIRIDGMRSTQQEFDMVRYLLKNAQVLKRMEIYSRPDGIDFEAKFNALQRISLFHRGSVACELAFF